MASLSVDFQPVPLDSAMLRKVQEVYVYVEMNELVGQWIAIPKSEISKCIKRGKCISKYKMKGDSLWIG